MDKVNPKGSEPTLLSHKSGCLGLNPPSHFESCVGPSQVTLLGVGKVNVEPPFVILMIWPRLLGVSGSLGGLADHKI